MLNFDARHGSVLIGWKVCRQRHPVLHLDVVVGEDVDVQETIDVCHHLFQVLPDQPSHTIGAVIAPWQAVVVEARYPGVAERVQTSVQSWRFADGFQHPDPGVIDPTIAPRTSRRACIERHDTDDEIDEMVSKTTTDPAIRVRKPAVQPESGRFDRAARQNDDVCVLGEGIAARADTPCHGPGVSVPVC
jgi:hypothetical protein